MSTAFKSERPQGTLVRFPRREPVREKGYRKIFSVDGRLYKRLPPSRWHEVLPQSRVRADRGVFNFEKWYQRVRFFGCRCSYCGWDLSIVLVTREDGREVYH